MTPLKRAKKIEKLIGVSNLFFKLEGKNKSGTFKSRAADILVKDAIKRDSCGITIGTCGNFGLAIIKSSPSNFLCEIFVPQQYENTNLVEKISKTKNIKLHFIKGTYEDAVEKSISFSQKTDFYNANPQNRSARLSIIANSDIAKEIHFQLKNNPRSIWISVGNGTGISGLYLGFKKYTNLPKICAVSSQGNNAITQSIFEGSIMELDPKELKETPINEPLLDWRSYQIKEAFNAVIQTNGFGVEVSDNEMLQAQEILSKYEDIRTIPASAAAFAGFLKYYKKFRLSDNNVIVLTA
jgi:threonine synthase